MFGIADCNFPIQFVWRDGERKRNNLKKKKGGRRRRRIERVSVPDPIDRTEEEEDAEPKSSRVQWL